MVQSLSVTSRNRLNLPILYVCQYLCIFMNFGVLYNYHHIYRKWVLLVDSKFLKHCSSYSTEIYFIAESVSRSIDQQWSKKVDFGSIIGQKNGRIINRENRGDSTH